MGQSGMPVRVEKTAALTGEQEEAVFRLITICRKHDDIRISYPFAQDEAECHYLLWGSLPGQLLAVLAIASCEDMTAECIGFTHPSCRRQGYFSRLLECVLEDYEETDILFPVSGTCADTLAALDAIGAEVSGQEHKMEKSFGESHPGADVKREEVFLFSALRISDEADPNTFRGDFFVKNSMIANDASADGEAAAGSLSMTMISESSVCLHHVEIFPEFRGKGFGTMMMICLFAELEKRKIEKIVLQVSGDNLAALALYKRMGFRITETLSYFLY